MNNPMTLRVLARLLSYPDAELVAHRDELGEILRAENAFSPEVWSGLKALLQWLGSADCYEVEEAYVECFDRGRSSSLHLFEHVHGDSRDRGQAMVDLLDTYRLGGMVLAVRELPDHLAVLLEFASTQPIGTARNLLAELAHILNSIHTALVRRGSRYAPLLAAVIELSGEPLKQVLLKPEQSLDESWEEPPAFGGCTTKGQSKPAQTQPIHFSPRQHTNPGERP